MDLNKAMLI